MWQVQWPHEGSRLARKSRRSSLRRWKSHSEWRLGTWQRNLGELCNCLQLPEKRGGMPALSHRFSSSKKLNWGGGGRETNHWTYLIIISAIVFVIRVGVAHTCRWLQVQHIGNLVPAEWVLVQRGPIIVHLEGESRFTSRFTRELCASCTPDLSPYVKRSVLRQEAIERAATWASVQPEHQGICVWLSLWRHKPAGDNGSFRCCTIHMCH